MSNNTDYSKKINKKWLAIGVSSLLLAVVLPSIFLLAKIAIGLIMVSVVAIATKIVSRTISNVLEERQADQNEVTQQTPQSKIINLVVGLISMFVGGISLFFIAQTGLTAVCTVAALALYEYTKDKEIGKNINNKLDEIAEGTTNFIVSNIEKLISPQSHQRIA